MKYRTFRTLMWLGVATLGAGALVWMCSPSKAPVAHDEIVAVTPAPAQQTQPTAEPAAQVPAPTQPASPGDLRDVDRDVLALLARPVGGVDKVKDGTRGKPYKVNLYADDKTRFNRLKVDLDRDEKWDESWTIKPDRPIERRVAPADDEKYTETYVLDGNRWTQAR